MWVKICRYHSSFVELVSLTRAENGNVALYTRRLLQFTDHEISKKNLPIDWINYYCELSYF